VAVPLKVTAATAPLLQYATSNGSLTTGVGLTSIWKICGGPEQTIPLFVYSGVTCTSASKGVEPVFIPVNEGMFPFPELDKPMDVLVVVQL
jgi:hypothetical protein